MKVRINYSDPIEIHGAEDLAEFVAIIARKNNIKEIRIDLAEMKSKLPSPESLGLVDPNEVLNIPI